MNIVQELTSNQGTEKTHDCNIAFHLTETIWETEISKFLLKAETSYDIEVRVHFNLENASLADPSFYSAVNIQSYIIPFWHHDQLTIP